MLEKIPNEKGLAAGLTRVLAFLMILLRVAVLLLCALLVLGALVPSIPYVSQLGSIFLGMFAPWFILLALLAAAVTAWRWHKGRSGAVLALFCLAALSLAGAAWVYLSMLAAARANGVKVNLAQTLSVSFVFMGAAPDERIGYALFEGQPLGMDIYRPPAQPASAPLHPILFYIHGGGWNSGNTRLRTRDLRWFANHGWLVFAPDYPLSNAQRHLWDQVTPQVGCGMAWVAQNAARYGGDLSHLALMGESSGGNLAINAAYLAGAGKLQSSCAGAIPKVEKVVAAYPVVDLVGFYNNLDPVLSLRRAAVDYLGGSPQDFPDRYTAVSSATHISAAAPPTLIVQGERDATVPPQGVYDFVQKARAAAVNIRLIRVPYGNHAFDLVEDNVGNQIFRQSAAQFLQPHP